MLSPRCNWAWGLNPPGGAGVKLTGSEKLGWRWRETRTGAGWVRARVLQDDEQVTVPDGSCGGGWARGGGLVCGGGLGPPRALCPDLSASGGGVPGTARLSWVCLSFDVKRPAGARARHLGGVGCLVSWSLQGWGWGAAVSRERVRCVKARDGWQLLVCPPPPGVRRRLPRPAVCVCTRRSDMCGGRGPQTAA